MMRSLAFLSCVRAFTAPRTNVQRALALRAGDAPDDKTLFALGVNVATCEEIKYRGASRLRLNHDLTTSTRRLLDGVAVPERTQLTG